MLGHDNLMNYFKTNFALMQHHKYNLFDLENMIPWERHIYVNLLRGWVKEQEDRAREQAAQRRVQQAKRR